MDENPAEMEHEIELRRERLNWNIKDLQQRVGDMTDWRKQLEKRPLAFLGAAFGAGLAVAWLIPHGNGSSRRGWPDHRNDERNEGRNEGRVMRRSVVSNQVLEAWEDIKSALVGIAVARFAELLSEAIPRIGREYRKSEAKHRATYVL